MMKSGALDYLVKDDWFLELLPTTVARVLTEVEASHRLAQAERRCVKASAASARWSRPAERGPGRSICVGRRCITTTGCGN